jgi:hypothetical protein
MAAPDDEALTTPACDAMKPFDYLLLLPAVVLGLALSDLAISTQRLLGSTARVRWDWLAPLAAIVAFLKILTQWWAWFAADEIAGALTFALFAGVLLSAGLLFLLAATALPDDVGGDGVDLRVHFAKVSRRYWLLFALHFITANTITSLVLWRVNEGRVAFATPGLLILPVVIAMAFVRNRWLHGTGLVAFVLVYVSQELGRSLGG